MNKISSCLLYTSDADAKREIASMAVDAAEKIIGKKLTDSDDEELISDIIDRM